jgi:hypothetical protein
MRESREEISTALVEGFALVQTNVKGARKRA